MAISYPVTGVGTSGNLTTSCTVVIPTVAVDDILFLAITCVNSTGDPIVTDDDVTGNLWAKILSGNNGTSLSAVYWKRATSATSAKTITVLDNAVDATTSICAALGIARGVDTGATPYANASYESNASGDEAHAGFTPGTNNAGIVLCVFNATNDLDTTTHACTDPGALDLYNISGASTGGTDCTAEIAADIQTTAAATGNFSWAQTNAASMSIAFSLTAGSTVVQESNSDTASFTETFSKRTNKIIADSVSFVETFARRTNKLVAEAVSLTENLTAIKVVVRAIGDTVSLTEGFLKQTNKRVADSVVLTENAIKSVSPRVAETVSLTETFARTRIETLGDTLGVTEALRRFITNTRAEAVGLSEGLGTSVIPGGGGSPAIPLLKMSLSIGLRIG